MSRNIPTIKGIVNYRDFNFLNCDSRLVYRENTTRLAWCRAEPTGKFRKIICGVQPLNSRCTIRSPYRVIPFGNQIAKRATLMAKRYSAIHAPSRLSPYNTGLTSFVDFFPVHDSDLNRSALSNFTVGNL
jgi:hypothetical protein